MRGAYCATQPPRFSRAAGTVRAPTDGRRERGIGTLPRSLREAIDALDADPVVRATLGDHLYHAFRDAKLAEYERYRRAVHPWEREQYLRLY